MDASPPVPELAPPTAEERMGTRVPSLAEAGYEELRERRPPGLLRRYLTTNRHLIGLLLGGLVDYSRSLPKEKRRGLRFRAVQLTALLVRPFLKRSLAKQPFPVQLRRRLERAMRFEMPARVLFTVATVAPLGLLMGMPLPLGMRLMKQRSPRALAWAWGVNGGLSVLGTVLAMVVSIFFGIATTLFVSATMYAVALVAFHPARTVPSGR